MTDNFDFKKFLMENKLGAYSKASFLKEDESKADLEAQKNYVESIIEKVKLKYPRLGEYMHLYKHYNPQGGILLGYGIIYQNFPAYGAEVGKPPMKVDIMDFPIEDKVNLGRLGYHSKADYRQQIASDPGRSIKVPSASVSIGDGRSDIARALFVISQPPSGDLTSQPSDKPEEEI